MSAARNMLMVEFVHKTSAEMGWMYCLPARAGSTACGRMYSISASRCRRELLLLRASFRELECRVTRMATLRLRVHDHPTWASGPATFASARRNLHDTYTSCIHMHIYAFGTRRM